MEALLLNLPPGDHRPQAGNPDFKDINGKGFVIPQTAIPDPALFFLKNHEKSPSAQQMEALLLNLPPGDHWPQAGNPDFKKHKRKRISNAAGSFAVEPLSGITDRRPVIPTSKTQTENNHLYPKRMQIPHTTNQHIAANSTVC
jgi:hypothetical protein